MLESVCYVAHVFLRLAWPHVATKDTLALFLSLCLRPQQICHSCVLLQGCKELRSISHCHVGAGLLVDASSRYLCSNAVGGAARNINGDTAMRGSAKLHKRQRDVVV